MPKKSLQIPIYRAEREAGIADVIRSQASISYTTPLQDTKLSQSVAEEFLRSVSSEIDEKQFDLFYLNTVLVTTCINKNGDAFLKEPVWAARYTPIHKQFNLEHDQSRIIGHMTSAKAVNEKFEPIDDETAIEDLPDKFHILTGAVIYRALSDEQAQENVERLIEEIQKGEWYVSMECLFRGFDYAVVSASGEQRIIPRNEETAWLTKHLRQYGGDGTYNGFSLGRVLRNITFSGKGLVRKPANPESIIFNENVQAFRASFANLGYLDQCSNVISNPTMENVSMANENDKNLEQQIADLREQNNKLAEQVKQYESSATTARITSLESDLASKTEEISQLQSEVKVISDAKAELEKNLKDALERANKADKELSDLKAAEITRARVEKLTKLNAPEDEAKSIVALFSDKNDEQFDTLATLFAPKWKKQEEVSVSQSALEDAEPEKDAALSTGGTNEEVENTRAAMAEVFRGLLKSAPSVEVSKNGS